MNFTNLKTAGYFNSSFVPSFGMDRKKRKEINERIRKELETTEIPQRSRKLFEKSSIGSSKSSSRVTFSDLFFDPPAEDDNPEKKQIRKL